MIEVFKTNVQWQKDAQQIVTNLSEQLKNTKINFDMEDCDKILRIEGTDKYKNSHIIKYLTQLGFLCEILD